MVIQKGVHVLQTSDTDEGRRYGLFILKYIQNIIYFKINIDKVKDKNMFNDDLFFSIKVLIVIIITIVYYIF